MSTGGSTAFGTTQLACRISREAGTTAGLRHMSRTLLYEQSQRFRSADRWHVHHTTTPVIEGNAVCKQMTGPFVCVGGVVAGCYLVCSDRLEWNDSLNFSSSLGGGAGYWVLYVGRVNIAASCYKGAVSAVLAPRIKPSRTFPSTIHCSSSSCPYSYFE